MDCVTPLRGIGDMHSGLLRFRVASAIQQRLARPGSPCAPNKIGCFNSWGARRATQPPWDEKLEAVLKLSASTFFVLYLSVGRVVPGETPVTGSLRLDPHESKIDAPPSFYWTSIGSPRRPLAFNHFGRRLSLRRDKPANALKDTASGLLAPFLMR